jgi:DnaK suppressor protein
MDDIRRALQEQLAHTVARLKGLGGAVVFEEDPGAREDEGPGEAAGDAGRISEEREMTFAVRGLLVERANRLAEALERLGSGEYGVCEICGEAISPARLRAIPEVTTCVRCQDAEERRARVVPEQVATR